MASQVGLLAEGGQVGGVDGCANGDAHTRAGEGPALIGGGCICELGQADELMAGGADRQDPAGHGGDLVLVVEQHGHRRWPKAHGARG